MFTTEEIDRIVEMAWEDRTPFEHIAYQFNINESDVVRIMRDSLSKNSFKLWRKRVKNRKTKHIHKTEEQIFRFRCKTQNKIKRSK